MGAGDAQLRVPAASAAATGAETPFNQEIKAGEKVGEGGWSRQGPEQGKESAGGVSSVLGVPGSCPRGLPRSQPCAGLVTGLSKRKEQLWISPGELQPACGRVTSRPIPAATAGAGPAQPGEGPRLGRSTLSSPTAPGQGSSAGEGSGACPAHTRAAAGTGRAGPLLFVLSWDFPGASRRVCNPPSPG